MLSSLLSSYGMYLVRTYGLFIILLYCFLGELPFLGVFFQEQTLTLIGGFLVSQGLFDFFAFTFLVFLFTFIGDFVGFIIGKKINVRILRKKKIFFMTKKETRESEEMVQKYSGWAIVFGKYTSITRMLIPMMLGASGLKTYKYLIYSAIASFLWAFASVSAGYILGKGYEYFARVFGRFIGIGITIVVLLLFIYFYLHYKNIFKKYHLWVTILNLFSLILFINIMILIANGNQNSFISIIDGNANYYVMHLWSRNMNEFMLLISAIFSPFNLILFSTVILYYLSRVKKFFRFLMVLISIVLTMFLVPIIKNAIKRERPLDALYHESSFSFPSGHATFAFVFFVLLMFVFYSYFKTRLQKSIFVFVNSFFIFLIGFSRIYLNVHWLSDVVGGYLLGLFVVTFSYLFLILLKHYHNKWVEQY